MLMTLNVGPPAPLGSSTGTVGEVKIVLTVYTGIGLCGFVVSQLTSQMTLRFRSGTERVAVFRKGGIGSERYMQLTKMSESMISGYGPGLAVVS